MAPATDPRPAALIVAHGQPSDPAPAEAALQKLARQVNLRLPDWNINSATMAAEGALQQALMQHPGAAIYPLFMADGWFTGTALPERLIESDQKHLLPPLGLDPRLPALAVEILTRDIAARGWKMSETDLIIAAHGGQTSPNPAKSAQRFVNALAKISNFAEIRLGFIEQSPDLSQVTQNTGPRAICLPFFAANGRHIRHDIPAALNKSGFAGVILDPIGCAAKIPDIIVQSLKRGP